VIDDRRGHRTRDRRRLRPTPPRNTQPVRQDGVALGDALDRIIVEVRQLDIPTARVGRVRRRNAGLTTRSARCTSSHTHLPGPQTSGLPVSHDPPNEALKSRRKARCLFSAS
jgi:hypothetical protein